MRATRSIPVLVLALLIPGAAVVYSRQGPPPADSTELASPKKKKQGDGKPTRPTNLTADPSGSGVISLSWSGSTDDKGVRGYMVFRGGSQIGIAANTEYRDRGLPRGRYSYRVAATDADGNVSKRSAPAWATASR